MLNPISRPKRHEIMEINGRAFWARPLSPKEEREEVWGAYWTAPAKFYEHDRDKIGLKVD